MTTTKGRRFHPQALSTSEVEALMAACSPTSPTGRGVRKRGGRRPALDGDRAALALDMLNRGLKVADVARAFSVSRATIYRLVEAAA